MRHSGADAVYVWKNLFDPAWLNCHADTIIVVDVWRRYSKQPQLMDFATHLDAADLYHWTKPGDYWTWKWKRIIWRRGSSGIRMIGPIARTRTVSPSSAQRLSVERKPHAQNAARQRVRNVRQQHTIMKHHAAKIMIFRRRCRSSNGIVGSVVQIVGRESSEQRAATTWCRLDSSPDNQHFRTNKVVVNVARHSAISVEWNGKLAHILILAKARLTDDGLISQRGNHSHDKPFHFMARE